METINIGVDLHGVLNKDEATIKWFMETLPKLRQRNVKIIVVSGPSQEEIHCELMELGYKQGRHFDKIRSVVDFLKEKKVKMWQDSNLNWWASDVDWWSSKALIATEENLFIMVDDKEKYSKYFKKTNTRFILL